MKKIALIASLLIAATAAADTPIAYRLGRGAQLIPTSTEPSKCPGCGMIYIDADDGNTLKYKNPAGLTSDIATGAAAAAYDTVKDEGSSLTQRATINFIGSAVSCVDNSGANRTDCTITGGASTLNAIYAAGVSTSSSVLELDSTRGAFTIRDNASTIGTLMEVTNATGGPSLTYAKITGNSTHTLRSGMADGGSAISFLVDTTSTWSNASARLMSVKNNNAEVFAVMASGDINLSTDLFWWNEANSRLLIGQPSSPTGRLHIAGSNGSQAQMRIDNSTGSVSMMCGSADSAAGGFCGSLSNHPFYLRQQNTNIISVEGDKMYGILGDVSVDLGISTHEWKSVASAQYYGKIETYGSTATPTFAITGGETKRMVLNQNVTSWTLASGRAGQIVTIEWIQDGTGGWTMAGTPGNVLLAGAAFTLTATANKRDTLTLRYDSTDSKWVEIGRAMNL